MLIRLCAALVILFLAQPASASDPIWYSCDTIDSVTGINGAQPQISVGSLYDFDGKGYVLINGHLEVASGGYGYQLNRNGNKRGTEQMTLKLIAPSGAGIAMISNLPINERLEVKHAVKSVEIKIEKDFNWGPALVRCQLD